MELVERMICKDLIRKESTSWEIGSWIFRLSYFVIKLFIYNYFERMKGMSIMGSDVIRNHQTNNSSSKNAFQFSKQKRFPGPNPQCPVAFYSNDSQLSRRRASFGYGKKSDFTQDLTASPAATKYVHKSIFDDKAKGKSFGLSRELSPDRSYLVPQLQKVPGPGKYQNQVQTRMYESFTMRQRTIDFIEQKKTNKKGPSPWSYNEIDLDPKNGRFTVAKFSDAKYCKINPNSPRFMTIKQSPGPLTYRQGDSLRGSAKYTLSHHKGSGTRAFGHTTRSTFTQQIGKKEKNYPGPGYYEKPTQFGVYGDTRYYKTLGSFKSTIE